MARAGGMFPGSALTRIGNVAHARVRRRFFVVASGEWRRSDSKARGTQCRIDHGVTSTGPTEPASVSLNTHECLRREAA